MHLDASSIGLGAVLYQKNAQGDETVIAYASRTVSKAESRYPVHKLEFLALKWAIVDKFPDYLYGNHFTCITDNNPLTYVLKKAKLDAARHRWVSALAQFNFSIKYRSGKVNIDADALSRLPAEEIEEGVIQAICQQQSIPVVETIPMNSKVVPEMCHSPDIPTDLIQVTHEEMRQAQYNDNDLKTVIQWVQTGSRPNDVRQYRSANLKKYWREFRRLKMNNGIL